MKFPADIDWNATPLKLRCPYNECGTCFYVGPEIQDKARCPFCHTMVGGATGVWPTNQWHSAVADIRFLYDNKKIELATIAAASYFEGCLHAFLWNAMYHVWEETRWIPRDNQDHPASVKEVRKCVVRFERLLDKNRGWKRRANTLYPRIFGTCFDGLVAKHVPDSQPFIDNRDDIHKWRNQLVHAGYGMTEIWPEAVKNSSLRTTVEFTVQCWTVFRALQNKLIAKVVSERVKAAR